ncbi:MAG: hypothetical protein ACL93V_08360 [Candidatus Electrothrix sp. YB6]
MMKGNIRLLHGVVTAAVAALLLCSCIGKKTEKQERPARLSAADQRHQRTVIEPSLLPKRFRQAGYLINDDAMNAQLDSESSDEFELKVGADITTRKPITLREAMKALVRNKDMSLSWASDVDQDLLVDISVTADDNFYKAVDNILRQLDYFHEMEGSTMVIKYRETKQYHIAMPFIKQNYSSNNEMGALKSIIKLDSDGNTFDIWENIQKNIDSIIATWSASVTTPDTSETGTDEDKEKADQKDDTGEEKAASPAQLSRRVSSTDSTYTIDKPIGLITVNAPKSLQKRIENYLAALEKELYKQIVIEAKIIEVQLDDTSSLGVNWHQILDNLKFRSDSDFGRTKTYTRDINDRSEIGVGTTYTDRNSIGRDKTSLRNDTTGVIEGLESSSTDTLDGNTYSGKLGGTIENEMSGTFPAASPSSGIERTFESEYTSPRNIDYDSDTILNERVGFLHDTLNMATSAATIITSGTGISETLSVGASLLTSFSFPDFIKALQTQGHTSILSNPKLSVMNGQPALISVGKNVTYIDSVEAKVSDTGQIAYTINTDQVLSGVGLALSAVVKRDNEIVMNLVPITSELSEPIEYRDFGLGTVGLPVVNMREMSTTVKIKDGSMLVVGGLISEIEVKEGENFVPGTKDIPFLKYLFGYEEKRTIKRELIILLRPRVI